MMSMTEAMRNIHFPESAAKLRDAQLRLKFDELFFIQLNILRTAKCSETEAKRDHIPDGRPLFQYVL